MAIRVSFLLLTSLGATPAECLVLLYADNTGCRKSLQLVVLYSSIYFTNFLFYCLVKTSIKGACASANMIVILSLSSNFWNVAFLNSDL
jgi:hypothetical protein